MLKLAMIKNYIMPQLLCESILIVKTHVPYSQAKIDFKGIIRKEFISVDNNHFNQTRYQHHD